jgi:alpha-tubulin suppressor-like RCC1 family protein
MAPSSLIGSMTPRSRARLRVSGFILGCLFVLLSVGAAAAPSSHVTTAAASGAMISAHLTRKSFTSAQAKKVKLIYKFSAPSKSFAYRLTFKQGSRWQTLKSVTRKGYFMGSHTMTVKRVFVGKPIKVGRYRLKLSADGGSKLLSLMVVNGSKPANASLPTISGTTAGGHKLTARHGFWNNSPTSYTRQWRRCNTSRASCSNISGATSSSYILKSADVGSTIRVVVTAKNAYGSASATSNQTAVVAIFATAISAGDSGPCFLLSGGTVECWGGNGYGQLGNGSTGDSRTPVQVSGISNAVQVSRGGYHACALLSGGVAECWGYNGRGQLGNGATTNSPTPVQVGEITNVSAISAGDYHTCALLSGGAVECWGYNGYGQLGIGSTTDSSTPVQVGGITNATAISADDSDTCALLFGGAVECWGNNYDGQLGNGTTTNSPTPVQVSGITDATAISAGYEHTCALLPGGMVECWGTNDLGQLGNGTTTNSPTPVQVGEITNVTAISAGGEHTCALLSGGAVECWGFNGNGQLGNGTWTDSSTPVKVSGITDASAISASEDYTCALLSSSAVECW